MVEICPRLLSIQSHVVSGYVGNKSATFPLQLLGFEVDAINSVQFSNHTGYEHGTKGQIMNDSELQELIDGLQMNKINSFSHIINGYIGSKSFLLKLGEVVKTLKAVNPGLTYVCDPVMGDFGPGLYVPEELLSVYKEVIIPICDICIPNQFEAELITGRKINNEEDAISVMDEFHKRGVKTIILSSTEMGDENHLVGIASCKKSNLHTIVKINIPKFPAAFVGTGDLFTALCTAWLYRTDNNLKLALEKTINTMQCVLERTLASANLAAKNLGAAKPSAAQMELKLIQCKDVIENPPIGVEALVLLEEKI
ncbi:pyridoxal kinase [Eurytemora carolleeae]|uniref:pyridoxal kinase n=1 Tax=Eurytemora carolleeae TaxID=1294199 RepID=UPI000C78F73F|nr:pyridoxal kinase [Eurytemora carolleeae]|eukprot:XP_023323369.1 pyridoxal kinase-like [Eurytemora affinis]